MKACTELFLSRSIDFHQTLNIRYKKRKKIRKSIKVKANIRFQMSLGILPADIENEFSADSFI